jgi:transporter family protein
MKWLMYALLSTTIYAFIPILDKINCSRIDPIVIATLSSIASSFFLIIYCGTEKRFMDHIVAITYVDVLFILATALLTALSWAFYYGAVKHGPVSKITTFDSASFILTILFSSIILKESLATHTLLGIVSILFGMYIITV